MIASLVFLLIAVLCLVISLFELNEDEKINRKLRSIFLVGGLVMLVLCGLRFGMEFIRKRGDTKPAVPAGTHVAPP